MARYILRSLARRPASRAPRKSVPSLPLENTQSSTKPRTPDSSLLEISRFFSQGLLYEAFRRTIHTDIVCNCEPDSSEDPNQLWFECRSCQKQQHVACATQSSGVLKLRNDMTVPTCNDCKMSELHRLFASQKQQFEELSGLLQEKRDEAYSLCAGVLWKHYCNLPKGQSSDVALELTQTAYNDGAIVPVHDAPSSWVGEVQNCIVKMVEDAGDEMVEEVLGPTYSGNLILDASHLVFWRELARRLLYRGAYKGNKAEFGLMAEVLGLVERGTFWQEGWMEIQSDSATMDED